MIGLVDIVPTALTVLHLMNDDFNVAWVELFQMRGTQPALVGFMWQTLPSYSTSSWTIEGGQVVSYVRDIQMVGSQRPILLRKTLTRSSLLRQRVRGSPPTRTASMSPRREPNSIAGHCRHCR